MFFLLYEMIQFNKMSSLFKSIPVGVPKKQIAELNSRLKKETHELEHKQLVEALRRITKLEEEVVHLNKLVHVWPPSETASETASEKNLDGFDIWVCQKLIKENIAKEAELKKQYYHIQRKKGTGG